RYRSTHLTKASSSLQFQQPLDVAARDLGLVLVAKRNVGEPARCRRLRLERIVNREHDAVDTDLHHAAEQRSVGEETRRGDIEVLAEDVAERNRILLRAHERIVDPPEQERHALAE